MIWAHSDFSHKEYSFYASEIIVDVIYSNDENHNPQV